MKPLVYVIVGATATGKTQLALNLADIINGEIINADSMQIYRGMDIGTAKPSLNDRNKVKHHMIDICEPNYTYSVAEFQKSAQSAIKEIIIKGKTPIIAGGSGLYINSLTFDLNFQNTGANSELRSSLEKKTNKELYESLIQLNESAAKRIHPNNKKRVIRALELALNNNRDNYNFSKPYDKYNFKIIGLRYDRRVLYNRINRRVDMMMENGLEAEVKQLFNKYGISQNAFQAIGYKEFIPYFNNEYDYKTVVEIIKQHTRNFAKRQQTWFKRDDRIFWLDLNEDNTNIIEKLSKEVDLIK